MLLIDVDILVGAYRTDAEHHAELAEWLEEAVTDAEPLGVTDAVLAGFVRVVTHPRIFVDPTPTATALEQASALRNASGVIVIAPGAGYWDAFDRCCREGDARGNLVADAAHAASAVETGARFVTHDRDYARFPSVKVESPHP